MRKHLRIVDAFERKNDFDREAPTLPGNNEVQSGEPDGAVVYRLICPHHHIPWGKIVAVQLLIVAAIALVACVVR